MLNMFRFPVFEARCEERVALASHQQVACKRPLQICLLVRHSQPLSD